MDWLVDLLPKNFTWTPGTWIVIEESESASREMVSKSSRNSVVLYGSMLAVWSILFNIALCFVVSRKQKGRRNAMPFKWLVFNFSLVQIAIAAFIIPLNIWTENYMTWGLGPAMCRVWLLGQVLLCSLSVWTLLAVSLDRLVYVCRPIWYVKRVGRAGLAASLLSAWAVSLLTLVPIVLSMRDPEFILDELCAISMTQQYAFAMSFSVFFAPGSMIFVTAVAISIAAIHTKVQQRRLRRGHLTPEVPKDTDSSACCYGKCCPEVTYVNYNEYERVGPVAMVIVLIDLICVAMWMPFHVTNLKIPFCEGLCVDPSVWSLFIWLGYSTAGVTPILWFLDPEIRQQLRDLVTRERKDPHTADRHRLTTETEGERAKDDGC